MLIEVKALWLGLCSGWLLPAHHLCLLCKCFRVTGLPNRPTYLLVARPKTFIQQISWCSYYEKLKGGGGRKSCKLLIKVKIDS